jgi:hypothetical protein
MQAHALTHTRYFYSLNVIISHPIVYKEGLGYLSVCAIASRSSLPSRVCICNGHLSSELCCGHHALKSDRENPRTLQNLTRRPLIHPLVFTQINPSF